MVSFKCLIDTSGEACLHRDGAPDREEARAGALMPYLDTPLRAKAVLNKFLYSSSSFCQVRSRTGQLCR